MALAVIAWTNAGGLALLADAVRLRRLLLLQPAPTGSAGGGRRGAPVRVARWSVVAALALVLLARWRPPCSSARPSAVSQPIVRTCFLVTIDTLRRDPFRLRLGANHTPAFEDLAESGVVFLDAITPLPKRRRRTPRCSPDDIPCATGVLSNGARLGPGYDTLAETLRDHGYATGASSRASSVGLATPGLDQGFDVYRR